MADGVIRFPFVHWWMYGGTFDLPQEVRTHWILVDGAPLDPNELGGWLPRYKTIGLLENQLALHANTGYGQAQSVEWLNNTIDPYVLKHLPTAIRSIIIERVFNQPLEEREWQSWLTQLMQRELPSASSIEVAHYCIMLPELEYCDVK